MYHCLIKTNLSKVMELGAFSMKLWLEQLSVFTSPTRSDVARHRQPDWKWQRVPDNCPLWVAPNMTVCHYPFFLGYGTDAFLGLSYCHPNKSCYFVRNFGGRLAKGSVPSWLAHAFRNLFTMIFPIYYTHFIYPCHFTIGKGSKIVVFSMIGSGRCLLTGIHVSTHFVN